MFAKNNSSFLVMLMLRIKRLIPLSGLFLFAMSCSSNTPPVSSPGLSEPPKAQIGDSVIILIHGWGGDHDQTWGKFPLYLWQAEELRKTHVVVVYDYPTGVLGHSPEIGEVALNLKEVLNQCCGKAKEYILVGHSMGGIVAKEYVLHFLRNGLSKQLKVSKVIFIATPHTGTHLARWADWIPGIHSPQIEVLKGVNEPFLKRQLDDWQVMVQAPPQGYSEDKFKQLRQWAIYATADKVVPRESAQDRLPELDRIPATQDEFERVYDHTNIVKPQSERDFVLRAVISRIAGAAGTLPEDILTKEEHEKIARADREYELGAYASWNQSHS